MRVSPPLDDLAVPHFSCTVTVRYTKNGPGLQQTDHRMAQYNENEMVLKELKMLDENSTVFKLVGPVHLSQVCVLCICDGHPCCTTTRQPILQ